MTHYRAARVRTGSSPTASRALHAAESVALVVGAAVVTAASAQVSVTLPSSPIPFTLQPLAVLLSGAVLGARLGGLSQLTYLALGVAGASAFAWSPVLLPGAARLLGPTGGFLMAFPLAAFLVGAARDRGWMLGTLSTFAVLAAGLAVLYAGGIAWASLLTHSAASAAYFAPYAAADVVKILMAAPLVPVVRRLVSR
jgi:biotin transport system substrate-specific component